jgi:hypothetical protein
MDQCTPGEGLKLAFAAGSDSCGTDVDRNTRAEYTWTPTNSLRWIGNRTASVEDGISGHPPTFFSVNELTGV